MHATKDAPGGDGLEISILVYKGIAFPKVDRYTGPYQLIMTASCALAKGPSTHLLGPFTSLPRHPAPPTRSSQDALDARSMPVIGTLRGRRDRPFWHA